jgi:hypothetical protein
MYQLDKPDYFLLYNDKNSLWNLQNIYDLIDLSDKYVFNTAFMLLSGFNGKTPQTQIDNFPFSLVEQKYKEATDRGKKFYYVLECLPEATSYHYDCRGQKMVEHMKKIMDKCNLEPHQVIHLSGAHDENPSPYQHCLGITQFGTGLEFIDSFADKVPQHHFVSLSNYPRRHRVLATVQMWDRQLEKYGYISLNMEPNGGWNGDAMPDRYRYRLPAYIDGAATGDGIFKLRNSETATAFINVVLETSIEYGVCDRSWHPNFFTEKSIKPFAWGHVPMFITTAHHVRKIRRYGYDLFDDLIDHSYDEELDPYKRITMVVNQLQDICLTMSLEKIQKFKIDNMDRFLRNRRIASMQCMTYNPDSNPTMEVTRNQKTTADNLNYCINHYQP